MSMLYVLLIVAHTGLAILCYGVRIYIKTKWIADMKTYLLYKDCCRAKYYYYAFSLKDFILFPFLYLFVPGYCLINCFGYIWGEVIPYIVKAIDSCNDKIASLNKKVRKGRCI